MSVGNPDGGGNDRSEGRAPVAIAATFRKPGSTPYNVVVTDFSRTGCRVETLSKTHVGDRIWLTLPGFQAVEGVVRWRSSRGFGVQWEATIHTAVFDHIRLRYPDIYADPDPR